MNTGQIRVGTRVKGSDPNYPNFINILCLTPSTPYGSLSPYTLCDVKTGYNMENVWQFSKLYKTVPKSTQHYSRWDQRVIWDHPEEIHVDSNNNVTNDYWVWRQKGFEAKYAIRYPVGFKHRTKCLCSIYHDTVTDEYIKLDYISARKKIYLPTYIESVKDKSDFLYLKQLLDQGENLLIIEVDGPKVKYLQHYKDCYGVGDDFIEDNTILINEENINIMLNSDKAPFGHGYCLAMALLNMEY